VVKRGCGGGWWLGGWRGGPSRVGVEEEAVSGLFHVLGFFFFFFFFLSFFLCHFLLFDFCGPALCFCCLPSSSSSSSAAALLSRTPRFPLIASRCWREKQMSSGWPECTLDTSDGPTDRPTAGLTFRQERGRR